MMTKDEIKKALECCSNPSINPCKDCPYNKNGDFSYCNDKILKDTLNLITEQEKEIERLKAENEKVYTVRNDLLKENDELIKTNAELLLLPKQAVKQAKIDVLNRLKSLSIYDDNYLDGYVFIDDIDKLLEEYENDATRND